MSERTDQHIARIATALERMATAMEQRNQNDELRAWASDALDCIQQGRELMPVERLSDWREVNGVIARYADDS